MKFGRMCLCHLLVTKSLVTSQCQVAVSFETEDVGLVHNHMTTFLVSQEQEVWTEAKKHV